MKHRQWVRSLGRQVDHRAVVSVAVRTNAHEDRGVGVILSTNPLYLLVASHLVSPLLDQESATIRVNGKDLGQPAVLRNPSLAKDELTVLRMPGQLKEKTWRALPLPLKPRRLAPGDSVELIALDSSEGHRLSGTVIVQRVDQHAEWVTTDIPGKAGMSGCPVLSNGMLVGICQAVGSNDLGTGSNTIATRLSASSLKELRQSVPFQRRRRSRKIVLMTSVSLAILGAIAYGGIGGFLRGNNDESERGIAPSTLRTSTVRVLYVHGAGAVSTGLMEEKLKEKGFKVTSEALAPADLTAYNVVVAHVNAPAPRYLEAFLARGGGVVLLEATPYYLGMADVADWFGASTYMNAGVCAPAVIDLDAPFGTHFKTGDVVAKSACAWEGAAAVTDLAKDAISIAHWVDPDCIFAFARQVGDGRVYYQAQFGGAYEGEDAWDLFVAGVQWAAGLTDLQADQ